MKQFGVILAAMLFAISTAFADGTKQLMPYEKTVDGVMYGKGNCYLDLGAREGGNGVLRPFALYNNDGESCPEADRLYIQLLSNDEEIHYGFSSLIVTNNKPVYYRIKRVVPGGTDEIVYSDVAPNVQKGKKVPTNISTYAQAYYGPNTIRTDTKGYTPETFKPGVAGLYYIEFNIGYNFGESKGNPVDFEWFDITVVKPNDGAGAEYIAKDGRVYSKAWGLNTNGETKEAWSTFYTRSTDKYVTKVYLSGVRPYRFVFGCNHYGAMSTGSIEENRQSYPNANTFEPEYLIFLTRPNDDEWDGAAQVPNIPEDLTFAGEAMSCEDLIFAIKLLYTETVTLELYMDLDDDGITDKVVSDLLEASIVKERGFHYPWKNNDKIEEAGYYTYNPVASGCSREYSLSLFDQRFKYKDNGKDYEFNPGDTLPITYTVFENYEGNGNLTIREAVGTEHNPILITSKAQLKQIADALKNKTSFSYTINPYYTDVNNVSKSKTFTFSGENGFEGVYFYLIAPTYTTITEGESTIKTKTIELDNTWPGIGTKTNPFKGSFRAGKYVPNPIGVATSDPSLVGDQDTIFFNGTTTGLFNYCENATIENIHIGYGSLNYSGDEHSVGAIANSIKSCIVKNCSNMANITTTTTLPLGGIVGMADGLSRIENCTNYGTLEDRNPNGAWGVGGIVGNAVNDADDGDIIIDFCRNIGSINCYKGGGIVGYSYKNTISNCKNEGSVTAYANNNYAAGIVGAAMDAIEIKSCTNTGTITGIDAYGICTWDGIGIITSCLNQGQINNTDNAEDRGLAQDALLISHCISTNPLQYYDNYDAQTVSSLDELLEMYEYEENGFDINENGELIVSNTQCLGKNYRLEEAGRLYKDDKTFYIKWDGKDDNGNCVIGKVTIKYQKNSGVTHFPFYDPENINFSDELKGMVVYRISPIQDTITNVGRIDKKMTKNGVEKWIPESDVADSISKGWSLVDGVDPKIIQTAYQAEKGITNPNYYGYTNLPKDYYQTSNLSDEMGIELKLFWDDRKITATNSGACEDGEEYGTTETITTYEKKCSGWGWSQTCKTVPVTSYTCRGRENVTEGGWYGSEKGGHIFPKSKFGNEHTMNTWWNGVEVAALKQLELFEHEPAILMPVEIDRWTVTNLAKSVLLEWTTASEENNDYFAIERSIDGVTWKVLGNVGGAGTTSTTHYYSFEDTKPVSGISYYRLKQVDFNGEYTYSSVKCINRPANADKMYKAYVNQDMDAFIVQGEEIAACNIEVYNTLGVKMTNLSFNPVSTDKVVINVGQLPIGTYFIKICNGSKSVVKSW